MPGLAGDAVSDVEFERDAPLTVEIERDAPLVVEEGGR